MKKIIKIVLAGLGTAIVIVAVAGLIYVFPMFSMSPLETGAIGDTGVTAVKNNINNLHLIEASEGYILVDAGTDMSAIEAQLSELNISPKDIKWVLLTHTDSDHVGSLPLFSAAQVYMSADELQMVNGTIKRNFFASNELPLAYSQVTLLQDGQTFALGELTVKAIALPGHTPGSMAYLIGENLFIGDAAMIKDGNLSVHPYTMDEAAAKESFTIIQSLAEECKLIFTAHYGYCFAEEVKAE